MSMWLGEGVRGIYGRRELVYGMEICIKNNIVEKLLEEANSDSTMEGKK